MCFDTERERKRGEKREREREFVLSLKHALVKFLGELFQCKEREGERVCAFIKACIG